MSEPIAQARSFLFIPGHRSERFDRGAKSGADALILDLEDGVPDAQKAAARAAIESAWEGLLTNGKPLIVRINATEGKNIEPDLALLDRLRSPAAVMVAKAESALALSRLYEHLNGVALLPMIESAKGYCALTDIGAVQGVQRLVIGHLDFLADIGSQGDDSQNELAPLRFAVAIASRLNGLAPAVDGVTVEINDDAKLCADVRAAAKFGFSGKLCIHPRQIPLVHECLNPTEPQLQWARQVLAASDAAAGAVVQVDGRMVDLPVILRARHLLARVRRA